MIVYYVKECIFILERGIMRTHLRIQKRIIDALVEEKGVASTEELSRKTGIRRSTVNNSLDNLGRLVQRRRDGRWCLLKRC